MGSEIPEICFSHALIFSHSVSITLTMGWNGVPLKYRDGAARSVGRAMAGLDRLAPEFGVILPFGLIDERRRVEPDVPGQDGPFLEHVALRQVEEFHDERVEVIDLLVVTRQDLAGFDR